MQAVLETLMRSYTGLFSYPVQIDEEYVAARAGVSVPELRQLLYRLSLEHIIRYIPADHSSVVYLKENRLRPKNVKLSPEHLERLKSSWLERTEAMKEYAVEEDNKKVQAGRDIFKGRLCGCTCHFGGKAL